VDWLDRAGLRLVPAQDPGDPTDWIVNQVLVYRPQQTHVRRGRVPVRPSRIYPPT